MNFHILPSSEAASVAVAAEIRSLVESRAAEGRMAVLGLATGKTPIPLYRELVRMHREEGFSFGNVVTFNLDEYFGLISSHPKSYHSFMRENLFDLVDILPQNTHIPRGNLDPGDIGPHCREYEALILESGGIDLQILGIGRTGHIGFNEPGAGRYSRTSLVRLDAMTRADAAGDFGGADRVPSHAITMGCGTILEARRIILMAWGESKSSIVAEAFQGPVSDDVPASYLQEHPAFSAYLDEGAAGDLKALVALEEKDQLLKD